MGLMNVGGEVDADVLPRALEETFSGRGVGGCGRFAESVDVGEGVVQNFPEKGRANGVCTHQSISSSVRAVKWAAYGTDFWEGGWGGANVLPSA